MTKLKELKKWLPFKRGERKVMHQPQAGGNPLAEIHREIDQIFGRVLGGNSSFWPAPFRAQGLETWFGDYSPQTFWPTIDVAEDGKSLKIVAELPGMDSDDIEIEVVDDTLVLRGEKRLEESSEDEGYYRTERAYGAFERIIPLPADVDADHAEASFKKGVLTVRLPKVGTPEEHHKRIPVHAM